MLNLFLLVQIPVAFFLLNTVSPGTKLRCMVFFTWTMCIILVFFFQHVYRIYLVTFNRRVFPFIILSGYTILLLPSAGMIQHHFHYLMMALPITGTVLLAWLLFLLFQISPHMKIFPGILFFIIPIILFSLKTAHGTPRILLSCCTMILPVIFGMVFLTLHAGIQKKISRREYCEKAIQVFSRMETGKTDQHSDIIESAKAHIHDNYMEPLTREDVADITGISPDYLGKLFLKYTGKTVKEYINNYRTYKAAQMVEETDSRFLEIAHNVGFDCLATFNRYFHKIYGMSPRYYRKMT